MIERTRVLDLIAEIRKSVGRLKEISLMDFETFNENSDNFAIAEHHLRKTLEIVLDIGRHIIARQGLGRPTTYTQIFDILGQKGVLPQNFVASTRGLPGYRNRLVHIYHEVTSEEIFEIVSTRLVDIEEFCRLIVQYINQLDDEN